MAAISEARPLFNTVLTRTLRLGEMLSARANPLSGSAAAPEMTLD
ncbi:hypothetical protein [Sphaerothrix gracilis]